MIHTQVQPQGTHTPFHSSIAHNVNTYQQSQTVINRLATLSNQNQWVLFTAQTPRPSAAELQSHAVCCDRVIHMKASANQTEEMIVMKAIQSGNASAVVASDSISQFNQIQLKSLAKQYRCEVFFIAASTSKLH
ncbi:hypothetical protein EK599_14020 [Vibrio sp. T187]|uniref:SulA-like leucine-rich domain-containing protein n=1 Tax=Vibrio TaxID=662 RepID=UPI0010C9880E|nr:MULTISPECIES: SulA-like leucine-rich domain-containing protein [Vibrio]MBW3696812.1 hypothetical protein [Vibrio sp. T187]